MAGMQYIEDRLSLLTPHTYNALQKLVMAMAGISKNAGKKTFFGRDKGLEAYSKFRVSLKATIQCMVLDGIISESSITNEVMTALIHKIQEFQMAFPNWQDAYAVASWFFEDVERAAATIEQLRNEP
jgi:hypothetical protein